MMMKLPILAFRFLLRDLLQESATRYDTRVTFLVHQSCTAKVSQQKSRVSSALVSVVQ